MQRELFAPLSRWEKAGRFETLKTLQSAQLRGSILESKKWSEGNARIMMRAAGEVHFIACFKP